MIHYWVGIRATEKLKLVRSSVTIERCGQLRLGGLTCHLIPVYLISEN